MKRIIFPSDFSEAAETAYIYALRFAEAYDAELYILHVYDVPIVDTPPLPDDAGIMFDIIEKNEFESFREELPLLKQKAAELGLGNVKIESILEYGDLVFNVNKICNEINIDLIIMGTRGASGLQETFLGSNAASVIKHAEKPVLCVPADATYTAINNIAFTTQYKDKDNEALLETLKIARRFGAHVQCLYIKNDDDPKDIDERIEDWKMLYKDDKIDFYNIEGEHIEQSILDFIENQKDNLLVMRTHKRSFFENLFHRSLTRKMAYHSKIPLLVFHTDNKNI